MKIWLKYVLGLGAELDVSTISRNQSVVRCKGFFLGGHEESGDILIEFDEEKYAKAFEEEVKRGTAELVIDEDKHKQFCDGLENDAPEELRERFESAVTLGDEDALNSVLTELCDDYEICGYLRERDITPGLSKLVMRSERGFSVFGFEHDEPACRKWMADWDFGGLLAQRCKLDMND